MTRRDWQQEYDHLLTEHGAEPHGGNSAESDQRAHPRFNINSVTVTAKVEVRTEHIINASASGIAFNCAFSFLPHTLIQLSFDRILTLDATVVHCSKNDTEVDMIYMVQCKFADEGDGKQLLVMIMDMSELGSKNSASK